MIFDTAYEIRFGLGTTKEIGLSQRPMALLGKRWWLGAFALSVQPWLAATRRFSVCMYYCIIKRYLPVARQKRIRLC